MLFDFELRNDTEDGLRIDSGEPGRFSLMSAPFLAGSRPQEPAWLDVDYRWGKCIDFTSDDFERTFRSIMSAFLPVASLIPIVNVLYPLLMAGGPAIGGRIAADSNSLGGGAQRRPDRSEAEGQLVRQRMTRVSGGRPGRRSNP